MVEPIKENFLKLKENYKNLDNIELENSAISVDNEISFLYKVELQNLKKSMAAIFQQFPSFNKKHLVNHGVKRQTYSARKNKYNKC